jgi:hypothetical protein
MSVAPQDIAASRFKPIRQAQQQVEKAEAALAKSVARREELRSEIGPAERRDREALGQALVNGKTEPPSEAEKLKAELEREERRADALALAVDAVHRSIGELVIANRAAGGVRRCGTCPGRRVDTRTRSSSSRPLATRSATKPPSSRGWTAVRARPRQRRRTRSAVAAPTTLKVARR